MDREPKLQEGAVQEKVGLMEFIELNKQMIVPSSEFLRQDLSAKLAPNMAYFNFQEYRDDVGAEGHLIFIGNDGDVYKVVVLPDKIDNFPLVNIKERMVAAHRATRNRASDRSRMLRDLSYDMEDELEKFGYRFG